MKNALILFAHGARDPKWAAPFERLQKLVQAQQPDVLVRLAFLELMTPKLPELVQELVQNGCTEATVVPIFFGQGGHVLRDLPLLIEQLNVEHPGMSIKTVPAVGEDTAVLNAVASYCTGALEK